MSIEVESVLVLQRPGDNTGQGITVAQIDAVNGIRATSPAKVKQDANLLHDKQLVNVPMFSAPAAGGYFVFTVQEGFWQVLRVIYDQVTNGTSATIDVQVCTSAQAPNAGTTQLTAVINANTAGNNNLDVLGTIIAPPTTFGPGNRIGMVIGGTVTGMVGNLQIELIRIS